MQLPWGCCSSLVPKPAGLPIPQMVCPCEEWVQSIKPSVQYLLVSTADCAASLLACPNTMWEINAKYFHEYSFEFTEGGGNHTLQSCGLIQQSIYLHIELQACSSVNLLLINIFQHLNKSLSALLYKNYK